MAKFGEGDARWIVQDRKDGTNVNNWHWSEKDCSQWTRQRLGELLGSITLVDSPYKGKVATDGLKSVEGDSFLNIRKNKLVATYELDIKVAWSGTGPHGEASGTLHLPYLAEENHDEDPEIKVICDVENTASHALKSAILSDGKKVIYSAINTYIKELTSGVPATASSTSTSGAAAGAAAGASTANGSSSKATATTTANGTSGSSSSSLVKGKDGTHTHSLSLKERFYCRSGDIFDCFVLEGKVKGFTQSPAEVDAKPGGKWSWFGGSITGSFEEMEAPKKLVMTWRFSSWEEGVESKVVIKLEEPEPGNTVLQLKHTGIPDVDKFGNGNVVGQVENGWQQQVFGRIKGVFGYGV